MKNLTITLLALFMSMGTLTQTLFSSSNECKEVESKFFNWDQSLRFELSFDETEEFLFKLGKESIQSDCYYPSIFIAESYVRSGPNFNSFSKELLFQAIDSLGDLDKRQFKEDEFKWFDRALNNLVIVALRDRDSVEVDNYMKKIGWRALRSMSFINLGKNQFDPSIFPKEKTIGVLFENSLNLTIDSVLDNSPAQIIGLKKGDFVEKLNGIEVKTIEEFKDILGNLETFFISSIVVRRSKENRTLEFTFEIPEEKMAPILSLYLLCGYLSTGNIAKAKSILSEEELKKSPLGILVLAELYRLDNDMYKSFIYAKMGVERIESMISPDQFSISAFIADTGDPYLGLYYKKALDFLGYSYLYGENFHKDIPSNPKRSIELLQRAAFSSPFYSNYLYQGFYYAKEEKDYVKAIETALLIPEGTISYAIAQNFIGVIYKNELKDLEKSKVHLANASKAGNEASPYSLGLIYLDQGKIDLAEEMFQLSSERGYVHALTYYGELLISGDKLEPNLDKGYDYLKSAYDMAHPRAKLNLPLLASLSSIPKLSSSDQSELRKEFLNNFRDGLYEDRVNSEILLMASFATEGEDEELWCEFLLESSKLGNDIASTFNAAACEEDIETLKKLSKKQVPLATAFLLDASLEQEDLNNAEKWNKRLNSQKRSKKVIETSKVYGAYQGFYLTTSLYDKNETDTQVDNLRNELNRRQQIKKEMVRQERERIAKLEKENRLKERQQREYREAQERKRRQARSQERSENFGNFLGNLFKVAATIYVANEIVEAVEGSSSRSSSTRYSSTSCNSNSRYCDSSSELGYRLLEEQRQRNERAAKEARKRAVIDATIKGLYQQEDTEWHWDEINNPYGGSWWRCRGLPSGQFAPDEKCFYDLKVDDKWPGLGR